MNKYITSYAKEPLFTDGFLLTSEMGRIGRPPIDIFIAGYIDVFKNPTGGCYAPVAVITDIYTENTFAFFTGLVAVLSYFSPVTKRWASFLNQERLDLLSLEDSSTNARKTFNLNVNPAPTYTTIPTSLELANKYFTDNLWFAMDVESNFLNPFTTVYELEKMFDSYTNNKFSLLWESRNNEQVILDTVCIPVGTYFNDESSQFVDTRNINYIYMLKKTGADKELMDLYTSNFFPGSKNERSMTDKRKFLTTMEPSVDLNTEYERVFINPNFVIDLKRALELSGTTF